MVGSLQIASNWRIFSDSIDSGRFLKKEVFVIYCGVTRLTIFLINGWQITEDNALFILESRRQRTFLLGMVLK
jgi:hypothetical protein